jgi:hypothetical protein
MSETPKPAIYSALSKVMAEVGHIGKTRKNAAQNYQFRGVDDVVAHVQDVMAQHGVLCVPRVVERERDIVPSKSGGSMASVRLLVEHTFYAADGSHVVCTTLGEAMDSGDKASNKAMSAALKYALTETLLIPTYEVDRDTEEHSPQITPPPGVTSKPAPPSPPVKSNVTPINGAPTTWEIRINEAQTCAALAVIASELHRQPEATRARYRDLYNRRNTELAAREKAGGR